MNWGRGDGQETAGVEPPRPEPGEAFNGSRVRHGTESGNRHHQVLGEEPCESCRQAKAHADWRRLQATDKQLRNRVRARAQAKAEGEVIRAHVEEYHEAYDRWIEKLLREAGLPPRQHQRKKLRRA
jgi:hypothetical protein